MSDSQHKVVSILDQYKVKAQASEAAQAEPTPGKDYKAYGVDAPQKRPTLIAIYYGDGQKSLVQKSFMSEVLFTSHQHVSMIFNNCVITLHGQHLDNLLELLQDERILSLHCFNPKLHDKPAEGEILITKIERRGPGEVLMRK